MAVFSHCNRTVLPLTPHLISHRETEKLPFVTGRTKNRDSQVVSFYICHMFESGL